VTMDAVRKGLRAFGRFWWDFLVGDTPELFVATVVLVGVAFGLRSDHVAAVVTLPLLAIAMLVASTYRGRRRAPARGGAGGDPGRAPARRALVGRRRSTGS
jgi:hypothetical protein